MTPVLSQELVLEAPIRDIDSGGGQSVTWQAMGTLWADIQASAAREALSGVRESARVTHRITIRSAPNGSPRRPSAECRFRSGNRVFAIIGVAEADRTRKYLTCWAEEGPFT